MTTRIIQIGNSKGIRIPKALLEHFGGVDEVSIEADADKLIISPAKKPRDGWEIAFRSMAHQGDDALLDRAHLHKQSSWDEKEWEW